MRLLGAAGALLATLALPVGASTDLDRSADDCNAPGLRVQVLGSGGGDFADGRASSSYLIWIEGKPQVLIDFGSGAALRFAGTGARASDLDAVLFTSLHADHTADLPMLITAAVSENRTRPLPIYGPNGNRFAPSTVTFVRTLLDNTRGVYRYLGNVLSPLTTEGFKLEAHELRERPAPPINPRGRRDSDEHILPAVSAKHFNAAATYVIHGVYPALAWRITVGEHRIVFSGDMNGEGGHLEQLAQDADLLIAHHAVMETASGVNRFLHMPPSVIGRVAAYANIKRLALSGRTQQTLGQEETTLAAVRKHYTGPTVFVDDLACLVVR